MADQAQQCPFCLIASNKIPTRKIYFDEVCQAFLDINPGTKGHLVLIPVKHVAGIHDLPDQELAHMSVIIKNLVLLQMQALGCDGVNVIYSLVGRAGQRSDHMIIHLIPRYKDDKVNIIWEPAKLSEDEFNMIFNTFKTAMQGGMPVKKEQKEKPPEVIKEDKKPEVIKQPKKEKVPGYW